MAPTDVCSPATDAAQDGDSVERLRRRIAELTEAVAARDAFITVAGHDLRNAMTPVVGQVDLLMCGVAGGKWSPQEIEQRLERLQRVIGRYLTRAKLLLDVSRLTGGRLRLSPEPFDLAAMLRQVAGDLRPAPRSRSAGVQVAAPDSLMVTLDHAATEQVVSNLLFNALQHGAPTPVEVSAAAVGQQVRIQVRGGGSGLSAADQPRFSGPFEHAVLESDRTGFGIELWVVGQFVAAMEGTITIDDAPSGEALLTVTLPLHLRAQAH